MEEINGVEYIRATEVNAYLECPSRFYFQAIEKVEVPNKIALAGGTAVHKALEVNFHQKIESREDLKIQEVNDVLSSEFDKEVENVDKADFEIEKPGKVKDDWIEVVGIYMKDTATRIFPSKVEERIKLKLKGYAYGLTGKIDVFDEYDVVTDHKTTSKPYKELPENYKLQVGGAYPLLRQGMAMTNQEEHKPKSSRIDYLIRRSPKNANPHVRNIAVEIDIDYFLNVFKQVTEGIKAEVFPPNRGHMYCTRRFCKFWQECEKKYKGRVRE